MDSSQRANAAQMAARNIKAKPKGRIGGRPGGPIRPDSSGAGVPQFAPQPSQNGGGLFGGSIQGNGSFDFTAPAGMSGMTFAAPSFGSNATTSPDVSDTEGRFAGDDRAMKRPFGGSSTMQQGQPAAQQAGPFGQSSGNIFGGSATPAAPSGAFSFGNSLGPATSAFNPPSAPASNPFTFGAAAQAPTASPSVSFGSGPVENKPANSPFQFGQQAAPAQTPAFNNPFNFSGSTSQQTPAASQPQAAAPIFNFGSTGPSSNPPSVSSPFTFGSTTAQEKPATTPFTFGQNPAPPSSSGISFGSNPATAAPTSNIFGTSTSQPAPASNIFSPAATQPATNNIFGGLKAATPAPNNLFGSREASPAPAVAPVANLFGPPKTSTTSTAPPPTPNLFGEQNPPAPSNIFAGLNQPAPANNIFSSPAKTSTPANNMFAKPASETGTNNLFGHLNKAADEPAKTNSTSSSGPSRDATISKPETSSLFNKPPPSTLFGQSSPSNVNGASVNFSSPSKSSSLQQTPTPSSPLKPLDAPMAANRPPPSGMSSSLPGPNNSLQVMSQQRKTVAWLGTNFPIPEDHPALAAGVDPFDIPDDHIARVLPVELRNKPQLKANWITKYRIEAMNNSLSIMFDGLPADINPRPKLVRYLKQRAKIIEDHNAAMQELGITEGVVANPWGPDPGEAPAKRKLTTEEGQENGTPSKRTKEQSTQPPQSQAPTFAAAPAAPAAAVPKPQSNGFLGSGIGKPPNTAPFKPSPLGQNATSMSSPPSSSPVQNGAVSSSFASSSFGQNGTSSSFTPSSAFGKNGNSSSLVPSASSQNGTSSNVATPSPTKNKRKAESQITKDTEEASPLRQIKTPRLNGSTVGSNTSNIFKNILDSPSPSKSGSPEKKAADETPRANPFGKLPGATSPTKSAFSQSPAAPASKDDTPKANPFGKLPGTTSPTKSMFSQSPAAPASKDDTPKANPFGKLPGTTSPTKSMFSQSPPASAPKDDTPRANPFGKLPGASSPTKSVFAQSFTPKAAPASNMFGSMTPSATPAPSNIFGSKAAPAATNSFTPKVAATSNLFGNTTATPTIPNSAIPKIGGASANPFSPKPAATTSASTGTLKPPVFASGPVNFLAQFGQKASEDKEKREKDLLQKAIDEDYDSDDDLAEFKAKYHEKRKAELEKLETLAKTKTNSFVFKADGGSTSSQKSNSLTLEPSTKAAATTETATSKSFFSQSTAAQGAGNSVFSSLNPSRTSTPGPLGSSTGSVLDGHSSSKPVTFGGNIFGHLSDADSGKGNDADDESAEEDSDGDEENKDPNYQPGNDNASGPGTPASETGDGIASTKKSNFFSNYGTPKANPFGASGSATPSGGLFGRIGSKEPSTENEESGTSTPGRSLFDRVGVKDTSAEKEQSGTTTPGGSLFDRITKDSNGNPVRHISTEEKENTKPSTSNIFKDTGSPFANPFSKTPGMPVDKTWKPDSPIRFGGAADTEASSSAPTVSVTAATPTKTGNPSNLFGGPTSAPASNLFGSTKPAPFSNLFGSSSNAKGSSSTSVGFGFGAPSATSSLFPSAVGSTNTSRATSPGVTTDAESGVDGDPDAEVHEQINLTAGGPGEEDEEVLHEVRAKALIYTNTPDEDGSSWVTKGLGPLRVLQNKDTKATRMVLRADPLGTVVLNKALLSAATYAPSLKTVKIMANADDGKGLETWLIQVKTAEAAKELADVLEKNKSF